MGNITDAFQTAFRDHTIDGVASSGVRDVPKAEVRAIGPLIELALGNIALAGLLSVTHLTRAALEADLDHDAGSVALVYADATDVNNDLYIKVGASGAGSWTLTTAFHDAVEGAAMQYVLLAQEWAEQAEDVEITGTPGAFSALHHSAKAAAAVADAVADALAAIPAEVAAQLAAAVATATAEAAAHAADALAEADRAEDEADRAENEALLAETYAGTLAAGSGVHPTVAAGIAATGIGDTFFAVEDGQIGLYQNTDDIVAEFLAALGGSPRGFKTISALRSAGNRAADWDSAFIAIEDRSSMVLWNPGDRTTRVSWDISENRYYAKAEDLSGAGGAWEREEKGEVNVEDGIGGSLGVLGAYSLFVQFTDLNKFCVRSNHVTRGFGDLCPADHEPADYAAALLALPGYVEEDLVETQNDSKRYLVADGALEPISTGTLNGKLMEGLSAFKRNGVQLRPNNGTGPLFAGSFSDFIVRQFYFNGDNPTDQWGAGTSPQNNTETIELVVLDGYGWTMQDIGVRNSGGNGMRVRGVVGNGQALGGDCTFSYCEGFGLHIDRMGGFDMVRAWFEGNNGGGLLIKHDLLWSDATGISYYRNSGIVVRVIYFESSSNDAPVVQVEGGHFGGQIGPITPFGTGSPWHVLTIDSADSDEGLNGCEGYRFDMGPMFFPAVKFAAGAKNNTVIRQLSRSTHVEYGQCEYEDAGEHNLWLWDSLPQAFEPGSSPGDITGMLGGGSDSNFCDPSTSYTKIGNGLVDPRLDSYAAGQRALKLSGIDTLNGGTQAQITLGTRYDTNAGTAGVHQVIFSLLAHPFHNLHYALRDVISGHYYWPHSKVWGASGADLDEYGIYDTLICDQRALHYQAPFTADAATRQTDIIFRAKGPCHAGVEPILCNAFMTTIKNPAIAAFKAGVFRGTIAAPQATTAQLPAAYAEMIGAQIYDVTTQTVKVAKAAGWTNV